jgi:hypothetical protein
MLYAAATMTQTAPLSRPVIVHGPEDGLAALDAAAEAGVTALLVSPAGAAGLAGAGWFRELARRLRAERPGVGFVAVLDCADRPGRVLEALRAGVLDIRYSGNGPGEAALAEIAEAHGARLWRDPGLALDLRRTGKPSAACRAWLAGEDLPKLAVSLSGVEGAMPDDETGKAAP